MLHLDPDRLALGALAGEPLTARESDHLAACSRCTSDLGSMRYLAYAARHTHDLVDLPMPPHRVWDRIRAELTAMGRGIAPPSVALLTDPPASVPARRGDIPTASPRKRRPTTQHGPTWLGAVLVAAAAATIAAAVTVVVVPKPTTTPQNTQCAARSVVRLEALPGVPPTVTGYACPHTVDGQRKLRIHADGMPSLTDGDYAAWLLDSTTLNSGSLRMEALGVLGRGTDQDLTIGNDLDLTAFNIIDISAEPHDGNPAHSGQSMLRGQLR